MIKVICGLKGSGKTTYIKNNIKDSIAYDLDYLYNALTFEELHKERNVDISLFIHNEVRDFLIKNYEKSKVKTLYIARVVPNDNDMKLFKENKAKVYVLDTDIETIKKRLKARDGELPLDFDEMVNRFNKFVETYKNDIEFIDEYKMRKQELLKRL